jgi:hypothetical protein
MLHIEIESNLGNFSQKKEKSPTEIKREKKMAYWTKVLDIVFVLLVCYQGYLGIDNIFIHHTTNVDSARLGFTQLIVGMWMALYIVAQKQLRDAWKLSGKILEDFMEYLEMSKNFLRQLSRDGLLEFIEDGFPWHKAKKDTKQHDEMVN